MDSVSEVQIQVTRMASVIDIESEQKFDAAIISRVAEIIGVLPNLEV